MSRWSMAKAFAGLLLLAAAVLAAAPGKGGTAAGPGRSHQGGVPWYK